MKHLTKITGQQRQRGFTTVEVAVSTIIFGMVGTALVTMTKTGDSNVAAVNRSASVNRELHRTVRVLKRDLRQSSDAKIVVTDGSNGDKVITLQTPIQGAGKGAGVKWGAANHDRWFIRYSIHARTGSIGTGGKARIVYGLQREILDEKWVVQSRSALLSNLTPDGLQIYQNAAMWKVVLIQADRHGDPLRKVVVDLGCNN